jgi:hypothetical protein
VNTAKEFYVEWYWNSQRKDWIVIRLPRIKYLNPSPSV